MKRKYVLILIACVTILLTLIILLLNQNKKYLSLCINNQLWENIISTKKENNRLVIHDLQFNDSRLIIDEENSTIYCSITKQEYSKYNPNVKFKSNDKNANIAIWQEEITEEKIKEKYEFKIMVYNSNYYHIYKLKYTDLPIINIKYEKENTKKQKNIPMEFYAFDNFTNSPDKITISKGKFDIEENGYSFSLHMLTPGKNVRDNIISIFNMKPGSHYALNTINDESSDNEPKKEIELFINNEYKGKYELRVIDKKTRINNN